MVPPNDGIATDRIAIVGAGPSGVFAALQLRKLGYRDITLLERGKSVAQNARTTTVDGRSFDLATKFVPGVDLHGDGVYPSLRALLDECGAELVPSPDARFYDGVSKACVARPPPLQKYAAPRILTEFVQAYRLLASIQPTEGVDGVVRAGLALPDEDILTWGRRNHVESFAEFAAYLSDAFMCGPSTADHVAYLLKSRVHFMGGYLRPVLQRSRLLSPAVRVYDLLLGLTEPGRPEGVADLASFLSAPADEARNYVLRSGYGPFFEQLVEREQLTVQRGADVRAVRSVDGEVELRFADSAPRRFDRVLLTCAPSAIARMFPDESPQRKLFRGNDRGHRLHMWLFRAQGWPTKAAGSQGLLLDAANLGDLGKGTFRTDARPYAVSKEYADSDVVAAPVYLPDGMAPHDAEERLIHGVAAFGLRVGKVLDSATFRYPQRVPRARVAAGWFAEAEALQGQGGVYFSGEVFSGQSVPAALAHAERFIPRVFQR